MTDGWRDAELGDVVSILKGKKPRTTTNEELGLPYLVAEHLRGGSAKQWVVDTDGLVTSFQSDCLLLWDGAGAGDSFAGCEGVVASTMARLRPKNPDQLSGEYLTLMIGDLEDSIKLSNRGTTVPHVSPEALKSLPVRIPPLSVQRRIVNLMTHLDNHIANLRLERDAGRVVRMTMLGSLLDGTLVIPECFDGVFMGKEAMQHLLNRDDWVDTTLGAIADWRGGMTPSMSNPAYWNDGDIPWISSKEVVGGVIVATEKMITTLAINETSLRLLPPGVVVVVVRSGILLHTFPVAYVPFESTVNQDVKSAVPFDCVDGRFLAHLIESNAQEILQRYRKTGTTVQSVDVPGLMSYRVSLPTLPVQRQIVDLMTHLDTYLSDLDFEVSNLEGVRQQVLASLLSGAIEVPDSYESLLSEAS